MGIFSKLLRLMRLDSNELPEQLGGESAPPNVIQRSSCSVEEASRSLQPVHSENPTAPDTRPAATSQGGVPARSTPEREQKVYLGLDFGTSSTKVIAQIWRDTAKEQLFVVLSPTKSTDSLLFPSTVAFEDGNLTFGVAAESSTATAKVRSFKMDLPAEAGIAGVGHRTRFNLGDTKLSAEDTSTLFLAWVLNESVRQLHNVCGKVRLRVNINAAAPLDQLAADARLKALFHRIVFRAIALCREAKNPWPLASAVEALGWARGTPVPAESESAVMIFPETHAAMTAYILQPGRRPGLFASVDVGAGTTDVAFFWFHATDELPEACYYGANSGFAGMDDIDRLLAAQDRSNLGSIRQCHARGELTPGLATSDEYLSANMDTIYAQYQKAFNRAYDRCRGDAEWVDENRRAKYTICLVGGGAHFGPLVRRMCKPLPYLRMTGAEYEVPTVPSSVRVISKAGELRSIADAKDRERSLLLLAFGLAHRAIDIPPFDENAEFSRVRQLAERPSHEEIYAR